jgi:DNA-binding protein HU-beta
VGVTEAKSRAFRTFFKIPRTAVEKTITSFISTVGEVLRAGDKITVPGVGTFCLSRWKARRGRNPRAGPGDYHTGNEGTAIEGGKALKEGCSGLKHKTSNLSTTAIHEGGPSAGVPGSFPDIIVRFFEPKNKEFSYYYCCRYLLYRCDRMPHFL